ncbi:MULTISPECIES: helix-turn-helix domain-containing protein [Streptomyces]|uniref:Helix-turn-helix domain-containing protein n=1 Tax=Streptomyces bacillaris TaxID=68179 RepID=A0ABW6DQ42_9ACTN|nr:helix-turn-helix transcriptional regulator [Streptomyces nanshensis]
MDPQPISASVIKRIRRSREERGFSAQTLADAITAKGFKLSRETLSGAENGFRETIPVDVLVLAAEVLGVPPSRLLSDGAWCGHCNDQPPSGFTCNACGVTT